MIWKLYSFLKHLLWKQVWFFLFDPSIKALKILPWGIFQVFFFPSYLQTLLFSFPLAKAHTASPQHLHVLL